MNKIFDKRVSVPHTMVILLKRGCFGGVIVSTEMLTLLEACRDRRASRKTHCKTLVANNDNYALAA